MSRLKFLLTRLFNSELYIFFTFFSFLLTTKDNLVWGKLLLPQARSVRNRWKFDRTNSLYNSSVVKDGSWASYRIRDRHGSHQSFVTWNRRGNVETTQAGSVKFARQIFSRDSLLSHTVHTRDQKLIRKSVEDRLPR